MRLNMRSNKRMFKSIMVIAIIAYFVAISLTSCKKDAPDQAIATFVIGDVTLYRSNADPRPLKHRDIIKKGDTIKTGQESLLAFQIGEEASIQIKENTEVNITIILENKKNELYLEEGKVFTTVKKLKKDTSFSVRTKTSVAAVRGTEFSVSFEKGKSVVAVNGGKIAVQRVVEDKIDEKIDIIEKGTVIEVTDKITTRELNDEEAIEFAQVQNTPIIENVQEKTQSDLQEIEKDFLRNKEGGKDQTNTEKDDTEINKDGETAKELDDPDKNQPESDKEEKGKIWTAKRTYKATETIVVLYKNLPDSKYVWISVAKKAATGRNYEHYNWTQAKTDGSMPFADLGLEPGEYEARAHFSRSHDINLRHRFKVNK